MLQEVARPERTAPAPIDFRETSKSGTVHANGDVTHQIVVDLAGHYALDFARHAIRVYQVRAADAGFFGLIAQIDAVEKPDGTIDASIWVQGGSSGSRRYTAFYGTDALTVAKAHIRRWAGRRFRVAKES